MNIIINTILIFNVVVADFDQGQYNYLLKGQNSPSEPIYLVAYTSPIPLVTKGFSSLLGRFKGECYKGWGIDEQNTKLTNQWISYRQYICTTTSLEILND